MRRLFRIVALLAAAAVRTEEPIRLHAAGQAAAEVALLCLPWGAQAAGESATGYGGGDAEQGATAGRRRAGQVGREPDHRAGDLDRRNNADAAGRQAADGRAKSSC